ncbi:MAG: hypothetical protein AAGD38_00610 [Acidobacteriota bacterium]
MALTESPEYAMSDQPTATTEADTAPATPPVAPLSSGRKMVFVVLLLVILWGIAELLAWVGLSFLGRDLASWSSMAERRGRITGTVDTEIIDERVVHNAVLRNLRAEQVIHPYLGFIFDNDHELPFESDAGARSLGFPHNIHPVYAPPSDDRVVVAIFGGSVANHLAVAGRETLESKLGEIYGKEVAVLTFALPGLKQPQQLMALNYVLALGIHLDVVLTVDGFNDIVLPITDNIHFGVNPAFPRLWGFRVSDLDGDVRRVVGEISYLNARRQQRAETFERAPLRFSFVAGVLYAWRDRDDAMRIAALESGGQAIDLTASFQAVGPTYDTAADDDQTYRELAALWQRSSTQMHRLATGLGIEYYHFLQPNQYVPDSKPLTDDELATAYTPTRKYRTIVEAAFPILQRSGKVMRREGIAFHDMTGIFRDNTDTLYIDDCCHMNFRGNVLFAEAVAAAIADDRAE